MKFQRRQFLRLAAGAAALPVASRRTHAAGLSIAAGPPGYRIYPGGSADLTARLMGQWLSERLGQSFVIENRPGGGTNIATEAVVGARRPTVTRFCLPRRPTPSTPRSMTSSISISWRHGPGRRPHSLSERGRGGIRRSRSTRSPN